MIHSWFQHFNRGHPQPSWHTKAQSKAERKGKKEGGTSCLHLKAPASASERGFALWWWAASFPLLCNNKSSTCSELSGDRRLAQPARPWRPVTESAVSCPLEFSIGPVTLGLGKAHWPPPSLLTSRNAQAPHCSILPTPGTKRQTLYEHGDQRKKDPNPHQDTVSGTIFKNKKLETIGEWLSRRPRIRIKSYTAIERVSTEVGNPSKCQIYIRWQNSTCRNCKICQMIYTQMNKNRKWVCGESNSSDSLGFCVFFPF